MNNTPLFGPRSATTVNIAVFAARIGAAERAYILMMPPGHASKLLVVISHTFGQNDAHYSGVGYADPLSQPLINEVLHKFVLGRWGPQLLAASSSHALLMPVRAKASGGVGELGPFVSQVGAGTEIIRQMAIQSGNVFEFGEVEVVTFSSGIADANLFLGTGGKGLNFTRFINQDPTRGTPVGLPVTIRRQYLSGHTTLGQSRPGFEFMPRRRWLFEPNARWLLGGERWDEGNYLHTWCLPHYTLALGMMT